MQKDCICGKEGFNAGNDDQKKDVNVQENDVYPSRLNVRRSSQQKHVSYVENHEDDDYDIPSKEPQQNESFNNDEVEKKNVPEEIILRNTSKDEHSHIQGEELL